MAGWNWFKVGSGAIKKLNKKIKKSKTGSAGPKEIDIYNRIHRTWLKKEFKKSKKFKTPNPHIEGKK